MLLLLLVPLLLRMNRLSYPVTSCPVNNPPGPHAVVRGAWRLGIVLRNCYFARDVMLPTIASASIHPSPKYLRQTGSAIGVRSDKNGLRLLESGCGKTLQKMPLWSHQPRALVWVRVLHNKYPTAMLQLRLQHANSTHAGLKPNALRKSYGCQ